MSVTVTKGEALELEWTLYKSEPTEGSTPEVEDITGATIIFTMFNNKVDLINLYRVNGTIVSATGGTFTIPITTDCTKFRGVNYYTIWATYANGNRVLWADGDITVLDKGGYN